MTGIVWRIRPVRLRLCHSIGDGIACVFLSTGRRDSHRGHQNCCRVYVIVLERRRSTAVLHFAQPCSARQDMLAATTPYI